MGAKGSIHGFCTSLLWLPNSLMFTGETSPNFKFQIRKFVILELFNYQKWGNFLIKSPDFYIWYSVSRQKY
jgi:hypothetical protein